jgi:dolichol kinase
MRDARASKNSKLLDQQDERTKDGEDDKGDKKEIIAETFVRATSGIHFYLILLIGIGLVLLGTHYAMGVDAPTPIHYLAEYIVSEQMHLVYLMYWSVVLSVGVFLIGAPKEATSSEFTREERKESRADRSAADRSAADRSAADGSAAADVVAKQYVLPQIVHRKLFHLLALLLFVPPLVVRGPSITFLSLSIGVAMSLAMILEMVRIGRVPPFGRNLHRYVQRQIDERDEGLIVLTHLYLLAGCGITMWLCPRTLLSSRSAGGDSGGAGSLVVASGLIATGVGDAMGAAVGASWGSSRHPIVGTNKSWEGSFAMLISMVAAAVVLSGWDAVISWSVILPLVSCTIVEACTTTIDNLVLPMVLMTGLLLGCCSI